MQKVDETHFGSESRYRMIEELKEIVISEIEKKNYHNKKVKNLVIYASAESKKQEANDRENDAMLMCQ